MIAFKFGMVVGIDYQPTIRAMMVAPGGGVSIRFSKPNWLAIVLADDQKDGWPVGRFITIHPSNPGIVVIEEDPE